LIELGLYMETLSFLNDLLVRASYADEKRYELYMARVVEDIDEVLAGSAQWVRLTDMYAWLVSVQPSYIPYVLRFVHWLVETKRYEQARSQLTSARNDVRYVAEVERLEGEILERESFQESGTQSIDLERVGVHFVVDMQFGDAGSARMLIDTGASMSVVKTSVLDRLNLSRLEREPVIMKTANGQLSAEKLTAPSVSLGGRILSNVEVVSAPLSDLAYDGLLGMSVLGRLKFYIDQEQNTLVIDQF
jgi:clan AA aspartic protease (TIGR02281 family)